MITVVFSTVELPCIVSDWTEWTKPDSTGTSTRSRYVIRPPLNHDGECPPLLQTRKGKFLSTLFVLVFVRLSNTKSSILPMSVCYTRFNE